MRDVTLPSVKSTKVNIQYMEKAKAKAKARSRKELLAPAPEAHSWKGFVFEG